VDLLLCGVGGLVLCLDGLAKVLDALLQLPLLDLLQLPNVPGGLPELIGLDSGREFLHSDSSLKSASGGVAGNGQG
jgi:hypothetical protein